MELNYQSVGYIVAILSTVVVAAWRIFTISHQNELLKQRITSLEDRLDKIESKLDLLIFRDLDDRADED